MKARKQLCLCFCPAAAQAAVEWRLACAIFHKEVRPNGASVRGSAAGYAAKSSTALFSYFIASNCCCSWLVQQQRVSQWK